MKASRPVGFTLLEMMASIAVLGLLGAIVAQMLSGALRTVNLASGQMGSYRATRLLGDVLEGDLRRATVRSQAGGYLNLQVTEDDDSVRLGLSVPDVRVRSLAQYGTVAQIVYRWDKKTKTLQRAEFHSGRDAEFVASTGASVEGANAGINESRRRRLSPAYEGGTPYRWLSDPRIEAELKRSTHTPLLEAVADLEITCYTDRALTKAGARNAWDQPDRLPWAIRFHALLASSADGARRAGLPGLRSIDFYVPLPQAAADDSSR